MTLLLEDDKNILKGIDRCIDAGRNVEAKYRKLGQTEQASTIEQFTARLEAIRAEFTRHGTFNKRFGGYKTGDMEYDKETENA